MVRAGECGIKNKGLAAVQAPAGAWLRDSTPCPGPGWQEAAHATLYGVLIYIHKAMYKPYCPTAHPCN